jgi:hypothetical protein
MLLPSATLQPDPISSLSAEHVVGHIVWGMMAGAVSLSLRYFFLAGSFAIILDSDHLINFLNIDAVGRMGHSIPFAIFAMIVMMVCFGRREYLLGSISFAAVFSHMSFDTVLGSGDFPILTPFSNYVTDFSGIDWIFLQLVAVSVVLIAKILVRKNKINQYQIQ